MMGKSLTLIGTALTLALTTNAAFGQSSKSPIAESSNSSISSPTEIKLSPEGFKILCEIFPLNSRCPGGTALTPVTPDSTNVPEAQSSESSTTPENTTTVPGSLKLPESGTPENTTIPPGSLKLPESATPENTTTVPGSLKLPESATPENTTTPPGSLKLPESATPENTTTPPGSLTLPESATPNSTIKPDTSSPSDLPNFGLPKVPATGS